MCDEHPVFQSLLPTMGGWRDALKLVEAGLDPNLCDSAGAPVIVHAARSGSWEVFDALAKAGANVLAADAAGISAFHYAIAGLVRPNWKYWSQRQIGGCKKMVAFYVERQILGKSAQALFALAADKLPLFRKLLKEGLDPNSRIEDPCRQLLQSNQKKLLEATIQDQNRRAAGQAFPAPPTLLMWAAGLGRAPFVDLLVSFGADSSARDDLGYSTADYSEIYRKSQTAGLLE